MIILHLHTKNLDNMIYSSWDIECDRLKQVINTKNQKSWRYHNFTHKYQKHNHIRYSFWDTEWDRQQIFVILGHFLPFYPTIDPKN